MRNTAKDAPRYQSIQALRAIAAILVVLMHQIFYYDANLPYLLEAGPKMSTFFEFKSFGAAGVHLFFVISGFVMALILESRPEQTPGKFIKDRITRIAPLYWTATFAWILLHEQGTYTAENIVKSLLFIPVKDVFPVLGVGWTLNYEMFFYALFAITTLKLRLNILWMAAPLLASIAIPHLLDTPETKFYGNEIILEFYAGIAILKIHRLSILKNSGAVIFWLGVFTLLSSVFYLKGGSFLATHPTIPWGIPCALIILGATIIDYNGKTNKTFRTKVVQLLGASSYAIYLSHPITGILTDATIVYNLRIQHYISADGTILLMTATCAAVGIAAHKLVEIPLMKISKSLLSKKQKLSTPSQA
jgi:peptidoglycan/LPS O-acetylase OafA/YrhL